MKDGSAERGFTLLEVTVATALTCAIVLGVCDAVLRSSHAASVIAERAELTDAALDVLGDVRAATAYDGGALARIAGKTANASLMQNGRPLAVVVAVGSGGGTTPVVANVTVTAPDGTSVVESRQLYVEAPAPGSVIDQPTPAPSATP